MTILSDQLDETMILFNKSSFRAECGGVSGPAWVEPSLREVSPWCVPGV